MKKGLRETPTFNYSKTIPAVKPCVEPISIIDLSCLAFFFI